MTVEQAVLGLVISYIERGISRVPVWEVEQAHESHKLSGRARIRGLRNRGHLSYAYRADDNTYEILSSLSELYASWQRLTGKRIERRHSSLTEAAAAEEEEIDPEEIRKFRESL